MGKRKRPARRPDDFVDAHGPPKLIRFEPAPDRLIFPAPSLEPYDEGRATLALHGVPRFETALRHAAEYACRLRNEGYVANSCELATEVVERIAQIDYLIRCAATADYERAQLLDGDAGAYSSGRHDYYVFLLTLYAEAFYYFAHRLQEILTNRHLPMLDGFEGVRGVTLVRNLLIEHAERGGVLDRRPILGGNFGIRLKDVRHPDQPPTERDAGLFVNARLLSTALETAFVGALGRWDASLAPGVRAAHRNAQPLHRARQDDSRGKMG